MKAAILRDYVGTATGKYGNPFLDFLLSRGKRLDTLRLR